MGGGRKPKKGQNESGAERGERTHLKKRGTERGDTERERGEGAHRGLPHLELLVHTVQGRSCGKVNSTEEFQSVLSHLQPSQDTIKMTVLQPALC